VPVWIFWKREKSLTPAKIQTRDHPGLRNILCFIKYTLSDKNPSAWNFLSPKPEVTCGTVAIIIRIPLLLCETTPYLLQLGASLAARSLTLLAYTSHASLSLLTLHAYDKQQLPSSLLPFRLTHMYSRVLPLAAPKNALHIFLSLCTKVVSNYRVVK